MKYIDNALIWDALAQGAKASFQDIQKILEKAKRLERLTIDETAALLGVTDPVFERKILEAAAFVKNAIYGKRVVLFAPLYISNICVNSCLYCAFHVENKEIERKALTFAEITKETEQLLKNGHKRILLVAGEAPPKGMKLIDYYTGAVEAIYKASVGTHKIKRVNINCAPLQVNEFKKLKKSGIGTYQIFQETYHDETYRVMHPKGPKSDPDARLSAVDKAFEAGIDDIGIGVLYGLFDHKFETLAMLSHIEHLEKTFKVGPHTISVPRIEPAVVSKISENPPYAISDHDFKKLVAILRLAVPYTGIIMSTRETASLRDELINLGVSQVSAASKTSPGGYSEAGEPNAQFAVHDNRSLDEVVSSLIKNDLIPSFCAACYRKERTGEKFMDLAKPGDIKGMCQMNALVTLKEYMTDFASKHVQLSGEELIRSAERSMNESERNKLGCFFEHIKAGQRDEYV